MATGINLKDMDQQQLEQRDMELTVTEDNSQPLPKVQNVNIEERNQQKPRNEYSPVHSGPYIVIAQGKQGNVGNLHPMKLGKMLYEKGEYKISHINRVGKNKLEIVFETYKDANKFVNSDFGSQYNINVYIPYFYTQVIGIIRGVDTDLTNEEIKSQIRTEEKYEVLNAFRFSRKYFTEKGEIQYLPTQTVKVTFRAQTLPKRVYLYFTSSEVETYKVPILQCHNCQRYGHYAKYCSNDTVCVVCAGDHAGQNCTAKNVKCRNCALPHKANSPTCTIYQTQDQIRKKMQDMKVTYREARDLLEGKISYAQLVTTRQPQTTQETPIVKFPPIKEHSINRTYHSNNNIMATKRKIVSSSPKQQSESQKLSHVSHNNTHGRFTKSLEISKKSPYNENINEKQEKQRRLDFPTPLCTTSTTSSDSTMNMISEKSLLQKFNTLIQEAPEYLRKEIEQLKLDMLPLVRIQNIEHNPKIS